MDEFKSVVMSPLTGIMDSRSSADAQTTGAFAMKQNFQVSPDGKLQTATGFVRAYADKTIVQTNGVPCPYKNWDWHDQGVAASDRQPPTLLFYSTANDGTRRLYLGTKANFIVLDETTGAWTQMTGGPSGGFGQDGSASLTQTRLKCAQLQNNIYIANGFDELYYATVGGYGLLPVTSLRTAGQHGGQVTAPRVIIQWSGVLMIMNVEEEGTRMASRIYWSNLNEGTNFVAIPPSISDFQDLDYGERILAAIPLLGYLYILTDRAIWKCFFQVTQTGTNPNTGAAIMGASLQCSRIYNEPRNQSQCIAYPNTLVSDGDSIYYAGRDAIYKYNPYMADPERTEWIYRSSNLIFDDGIGGATIDSTAAESAIAEYWPDLKEIHFSWPVPDVKYVGPITCNVLPPVVGTGLNRHTLVINTEWETCDFRDYGMTALVNFTSNVTAVSQSNTKMLFLGASSDDYCVKQIGVGYAREFYNVATDTYSSKGYTPLLRGVLPLGDFEDDKEVKEFLVDGLGMEDVGNVFRLRTGDSWTVMPINNNDGNCGILWHQRADKKIRCAYNKSADAYVKANVRPSTDVAWQFLARGKYHYYELQILKADGSPPVAGGVTLTQFRFKAITA